MTYERVSSFWIECNCRFPFILNRADVSGSTKATCGWGRRASTMGTQQCLRKFGFLLVMDALLLFRESLLSCISSWCREVSIFICILSYVFKRRYFLYIYYLLRRSRKRMITLYMQFCINSNKARSSRLANIFL